MPKGIYERKPRQPKGAAAQAVVPLADLIPVKAKPASGARLVMGRAGQPPITVQFGKIKITIEVDG